jgi:hypothetical protein
VHPLGQVVPALLGVAACLLSVTFSYFGMCVMYMSLNQISGLSDKGEGMLNCILLYGDVTIFIFFLLLLAGVLLYGLGIAGVAWLSSRATSLISRRIYLYCLCLSSVVILCINILLYFHTFFGQSWSGVVCLSSTRVVPLIICLRGSGKVN